VKNRPDSHQSLAQSAAISNHGVANVGIGVVLEWDPDQDLHKVKRFLPNGPAESSGHLQVWTVW
jgi:hypothetical protein